MKQQNDAQDAMRYRWLVAKLQEAYCGNDLEIADLSISCHMEYGCRNARRVQGVIRWLDVRDEPLNLDAAIDAAMTTLSEEDYKARAIPRLAAIDRLAEKIDFTTEAWKWTPEGERYQRLMDEQGADEVAAGL